MSFLAAAVWYITVYIVSTFFDSLLESQCVKEPTLWIHATVRWRELLRIQHLHVKALSLAKSTIPQTLLFFVLRSKAKGRELITNPWRASTGSPADATNTARSDIQ